ncbi:hypothetical protein L7F22_024789 [Adiantum nelumboides]|nr:hypothetical protein [Adiantum nelumboides]
MSSNNDVVHEEEGMEVILLGVKERLTDSVDRLLDSSPAFAAALRQSFLRFHVQLPSQQPSSTTTTTLSPLQRQSSNNEPLELSPTPISSLPTQSPSNNNQSSEQPQKQIPLSPLDQQVANNHLPPKERNIIPSKPMLPCIALVPALNLVLQMLTNGLDPKVKRISLKTFTYHDIQALIDDRRNLGIQFEFDPSKALDFEQYERSARQAFKNMAVCKSERVGLYVLGGIAIVHVLHKIVRKLPYIGRHAAIIARIISPTPIIGPLLGLMGASAWEERVQFCL